MGQVYQFQNKRFVFKRYEYHLESISNALLKQLFCFCFIKFYCLISLVTTNNLIKSFRRCLNLFCIDSTMSVNITFYGFACRFQLIRRKYLHSSSLNLEFTSHNICTSLLVFTSTQTPLNPFQIQILEIIVDAPWFFPDQLIKRFNN